MAFSFLYLSYRFVIEICRANIAKARLHCTKADRYNEQTIDDLAKRNLAWSIYLNCG